MIAAHASVDAVVTFFNEDTEAIWKTLEAMQRQELPFNTIFLVDDGSTDTVETGMFAQYPNVQLLRNSLNKGISFSRNRAIQLSTADYFACINIDVILHPRWTTGLISVLENNAFVGCVFSRMIPEKNTLLSAWRFRFHEQKYNIGSGEVKFAPGHAVLFRRSDLEDVGGYHTDYKRVGEDFDICERLRKNGLVSWYHNEALSVTIQQDTLATLSRKQMGRIAGNSLETITGKIYFHNSTKDFLFRLIRNLGKLRLLFLPVDVIVYIRGFFYFKKAKEKLKLDAPSTN